MGGDPDAMPEWALAMAGDEDHSGGGGDDDMVMAAVAVNDDDDAGVGRGKRHAEDGGCDKKGKDEFLHRFQDESDG
jgi:hypothetical protein